MGRTKEKWKEVFIDLGIIAAVISVVVLIAYKMNGIYPFGEASIARGDMVQQTIPAEMYYMWDVLHGKASPFFTWYSAFGMNLSGASSLGALLSPLNIFLYLSTRDYLVYFVSIFMILKMISTAYAMYFYLRKYDVKNSVFIVGGILYAFGAASLVHFQIMLVMDVAFLLPLIMIGMDRIFQKKGCKYFVFALALSLIVNVYTGGITLIFLFLSCGLRLFLDVKDKEDRRRCALWLGVSVFAALLLSAVISIPALLSIGSSSRTGDGNLLNTYKYAIESTWSDYEWKTVERMVINIALPCSCILFFLVFGKSRLKETAKKYKSRLFMVGLLLLSVAVSGIELLWHGGSRASWPIRFVFVITFVLVDFAAILCEENKECIEVKSDRIRTKLIYGIAAAAAVLSGWVFVRIYENYCEWESYAESGDGFLCILLELLFFVLYGILFKIKKKEIIFIVLCVQITCTSIISFAPNKENITVFSAEYLEAANNVAVSMETEIHDFERIKNMDYTVDHIQYPLVLGEEGISNYWHVIHPSLQPAFSALGYSINWTQLLDTGGTVFTDTLFQIKYYLSEAELPEELYDPCEDVEGGETDMLQLYKNKFELPFAVQTDTSALQPQSDKFATQNSLFAAVTGSSTQLIQDVSNQIIDSSFETDIGNEKKILYFYATNSSAYPISIYVNGSPVNFPSSVSPENQQYPADFCNGLVCLGAFQNEHVRIDFSGITNMLDVHLGVLDLASFEDGMNLVKEQNPEITLLEQNKSGVKIELDGVTKQNVFLPVSYDEGWVCKVNGKKVSEIQNIDGMLSIPVEEGKNRIELTYTAPGRRAGAVISMGTLLALAAFVLITRKTEIRAQKFMHIAGFVAYAVYAVLFLAFLVLFFVIPVFYFVKGHFPAAE